MYCHKYHTNALCYRSVTPQNWEDFSRYNKERTDQEVRASERLRDGIRQAIAQTTNDLNAQRNAANFALRKRIHEFERARDELEWQKAQTEAEIARCLGDIAGLEASIRAKITPAKLAQTRLENRTTRPNVELCRDHVQYGLSDEVKQIDASEKALQEKLAQARYARVHLYERVYNGALKLINAYFIEL